MTHLLTREELIAKLDNLSTGMIPAVARYMQTAALNVEAEAKKYCTPGQSPYYKAPYTDDNDPHRKPPHMRDSMWSKVTVKGTTVIGTVGNEKHYSLWVHDGTSRMEARPFILDAIIVKEPETRALLSAGIEQALKEQCE
jgi:HK97 gp10 family phage protein